jgi:pimeloyl-ACP methyl ester carboxylesterase
MAGNWSRRVIARRLSWPQNRGVTDLHIEAYGAGEPAVLVHGSGSWGVNTFGQQRDLADEFQVILIDRRGYGQSPPAPVLGWPADAGDLVDLLTELGGAHLVGHSSGGTVALLAAARAPHAVRSLVVAEPAVWGIADPGSSPPERAAADRDAWVRGPGVSAHEFLTALTELFAGQDAAGIVALTTSGFTAADWAGTDAWRHEAWPGDAPVDLARLAAAGFGKTVVIGGYDQSVHPAAGTYAASAHLAALQAERRALARRINARLVTFGRSMHSPMADEPGAFNTMLRDTWRAPRRAMPRTLSDVHVEPGGGQSPARTDQFVPGVHRRQ